MSKLTGAQIVIESLKQEGVDCIFGYPGGAVIPIYDELYDSDIKHYLTRHEQAAAHAADGYARSTGKVGVCIATSGPGGTNLTTGLATAYMDSVPLVAFTGQVPTGVIGSDAFQEADIRGISLPITKHNYLVTDINELATTIKEAFYIASSGRPGPVLIDLPKDVTKQEIEFEYPDSVDLPGYKPEVELKQDQLERAAEAINQADRPLLYIGGGSLISGAEEEVRELAHKARIPVTTTLQALGVFPETDPLSLGMLGMHGTRYANYATTEADLIIAVGARFDDRVTGKLDKFAAEATVVHIELDPAEVSKNVEADIPVIGDAREVLQQLLPRIKEQDHELWVNQIQDWKQKHPLNYENGDQGQIKPQYVLEKLYELTGGEALITTEVGQNQMWAAQYYKYTRPRTFISSGGLGTMGYGFPAAVGVQVGNPDRTVIDIAGDGSIQMNIQELGTISNYNLPVKVIILNNSYLGMVRQWQEFFYDRRYSETGMKPPDFRKLAEAYGIHGLSINKQDEVEAALKEMLETEGPVVLEVKIPEEENVFPMVPPGSAIVDMIGGK